MKQKVLFILNSLCFGGAEKHVITLVNSLDTNKMELSLAYLKNDTTLLPQVESGRLNAVLFCDVNKKIDWKAAERIAHFVDHNDIDTIVCTNAYPLLYGWLAKKFSMRQPRIIEIFHSTNLGSAKENLKMLFFWPLFRITDVLVFVCENQKKYWSARTFKAKQVVVVHNGIDVEHFKDRYTAEQKEIIRKSYGFSAADFVVGLCAAMRPEKAHLDLLLAIANLRSKNITVKGIFIGDGPLRPFLEQQIERLGLQQQIAISGFLADVRPVITACDVMTITSHHETFSIAALEAMALSQPMIMTNTGGAAEQIEHGINGYLYDCGNIPALADTIHQVMEQKKHGEMGLRARDTVIRKFSLGTMVSAYDRLFTATLRDTDSLATAKNV